MYLKSDALGIVLLGDGEENAVCVPRAIHDLNLQLVTGQWAALQLPLYVAARLQIPDRGGWDSRKWLGIKVHQFRIKQSDLPVPSKLPTFCLVTHQMASKYQKSLYWNASAENHIPKGCLVSVPTFYDHTVAEECWFTSLKDTSNNNKNNKNLGPYEHAVAEEYQKLI